MDFNYLYHRQQVSLMRAEAAACDSSRAAHEGLARLYGSLIDRRRAARAVVPAAAERGAS